MLFKLDAASPVPLGDQIASSVRAAVADGTVEPGERLPAARVLADSLGINVHTVLRGYQRLREEGLIELRRGRGAVVVDNPVSPGRARILERIGELVEEARKLGMPEEDLLALVRANLAG
ncbi:GntR family transcriptional regulator [Streptomyces spiroverticillatus]|uniref:GntR family transcriptional regulator n=1 Tax=Streptomyces finlayi TaxID=67296 RepID=A0A919CC20_9ACTN|nr:GntR family transcriptional regulator [Streptomyces finlayi]GHA20084.1 GntR family transcriptional regulator [Streptomyces spiroverticillatus]GHD02901.1 GntR family transcriptional regulator [Streptomyces finlayi]